MTRRKISDDERRRIRVLHDQSLLAACANAFNSSDPAGLDVPQAKQAYTATLDHAVQQEETPEARQALRSLMPNPRRVLEIPSFAAQVGESFQAILEFAHVPLKLQIEAEREALGLIFGADRGLHERIQEAIRIAMERVPEHGHHRLAPTEIEVALCKLSETFRCGSYRAH